MSETVETLLTSLTFFLALGIPAIGWGYLIKTYVIPRRCRAEAVVVNVLTKRDKDRKTLYCPVYSFKDKYDTEREVCSSCYSNRYASVGTTRTVLYDPYKPTRYSFTGLTGIYLGPTIIFCIGLFLAVVFLFRL